MWRCGLIQVHCEWSPEKTSLADIKEKMIAKHERLIAEAAKKKVQILGLENCSMVPIFAPNSKRVGTSLLSAFRMAQRSRACRSWRKTPNGDGGADLRSRNAGRLLNTAAVIDADGRYLGKYRKHHIPHCHPGFWEKFYFTPGNAGYPVFEHLCASWRLHLLRPPFPGRRAHSRAERRRNCLQSVRHGRWSLRIFVELEQPAHAVANAYLLRHQSCGHREARKSASSTAKVISAIREVKSLRRPVAIRRVCWSPI